MYPHAIQFETRRFELEQWTQLNRERRQARGRPWTIDQAWASPFATLPSSVRRNRGRVRVPKPARS
jgi:hypothetical protein